MMWLDASADVARRTIALCSECEDIHQVYVLEEHDHDQLVQCPRCLVRWHLAS